MEEAALYLEGLQDPLTRAPDVLGDLLVHVVEDRHALVDHVHDGIEGDVAGRKDGLAPGVADAVEGGDGSPDIFLHDIGNKGIVMIEGPQVLLVVQAVGGLRAHAPVRLDHDGIAAFLGKAQALL